MKSIYHIDDETNRWLTALDLEFHPKILAWFAKRLNNREEAEDLAQQVFVVAAKSCIHYQEDLGSKSAWIFGIAHWLLKCYFRDLYRHREIESKIQVETKYEEREFDTIVESDALVSALKELSQKRRDVIMLHFYYDLRPDEIAKRMGLSYDNVCAIKSRALKELRGILERHCKIRATGDNTSIYGSESIR
ncbi:MAG: sigma-70 family RNA polymerase sigma factor [Spirochaetaceae bacterium]|jgi:RNA polymerase sigma-70 factor (ECF subfamily)|nr:sigma-70 family RNA polymerase sigma factor [Spirochaetaceae bacterium]